MLAKPTAILLADGKTTRSSVAQLLRQEGYAVQEAATGDEALRLLAEPPNLVILDVDLPGGGGPEVCRQIRSNPATNSLPVLYLSAGPVDALMRADWLQGGADCCLAHPLNPRELNATVRALLRSRQGEKALRQSEADLADFFENGAIGMHWVGADGTILRANQAELDLLGYTKDEYIGRHIREFHADEQTIDDILRRLKAGQGLRDYEARMRCKDGSIKHVLITSNVRWENGRFVHTRCFTRDITRQKEAEESLKQAARQKDEFLAMLAHELRNPLAPIRNSVQLLQVIGSPDPQARQAREMIERQVEHLMRVVDDLLDVTRITRGMIRFQPEEVDLSLVLARAVESSQTLIDARRHTLEIDLPPGPLPVKADVVRLAQAFWNLLSNAAKYTPEGGRIVLAASVLGPAPERQVEVRVRDTGMGIPAEMLSRVFDLCIQVQPTLERTESGLGIGLTLARRLIEMHGGTVEATSPGPGQGSEFVVRLPLLEVPAEKENGDDREPEASRSPFALAPVETPPHRILVVDDVEDSAESLAMLLRMFGNEVRTAYDGPQALGIAQTYRPDVVLLDIGLPGMNGFEVAGHLRQLPGLGSVLLIAVTGFGSEDDRRRTRETGFNHHLVKPVDFNDLRRLLGDAPPR